MIGGDEHERREPTRDELERMTRPVVLEFGAEWCGHCKALAPQLAAMLRRHPDVLHLKVEDGPGEPLGRSFKVKLWPTLVFLNDGKVVSQVSRPRARQVREGLQSINPVSEEGEVRSDDQSLSP